MSEATAEPTEGEPKSLEGFEKSPEPDVVPIESFVTDVKVETSDDAIPSS
ncbi:MAG TPA: hypothetical protein VF991_20085 [Reyranella sp.]|jgi:hypothetical protein